MRFPPTKRNGPTLISCILILCMLFSPLTAYAQQGSSQVKGSTREVTAVPNGTVDAGPVQLKKDSDNDGMSDEDEVSNGTNPNDPADADGDADGDGLSNGDEVAMGSRVNVADSDGDGVSDGDEARLGFNPNDATNTPPVNATIVSIQVTTNPLELSINTVLGQQAKQLQVNGVLNTGGTVDLTLAPGTTYTSANPNVASISAVGNALPMTAGSTTITVQNESFTVQVPVTVSSYTPVSVAEISIPGYANSVFVQGNYVYVAAGVTGLQILDVSNHRTPRIVGTYDTPGNANYVTVAGDFAYVADGDAGLVIVNVSNKTAPFGVGSANTPGIAQGVAVAGTLAYVADGLNGLQIIDVTNAAAPFIAGSVDTPATAHGVDVSGNIAVVTDFSQANALRVINVAQPQSPVIVGNLTLTGQARTVVLRNNIAYVATNTGGLRVVNISNPSAPQIVGTAAQTIRDVAVVGDWAFGPWTGSLGSNVIQITSPTAPTNRGFVNFADLPGGSPGAVAADQQYVYVTKNLTGVLDNGVSGDTRLMIGRYQPIYDRAGIAPTASVITPQNGTTVIQGHTINLTADASDDVEVERVQFFVDNQLIASDRIPPYETPASISGIAPTRTIKVIATDLNGVATESAPVTINTITNPAPVVSLLKPAAGSVLIEGQSIELLAQAADDGRVTSITFTVGGVALPADTSTPFKTTVTVPTGVSSLTISARANDNQGLTSTVSETFAVTPPVATTVTGRVITAPNQPVGGAMVSAFGGFVAQTDTDGSFSIANVPSTLGPITVAASALVGGQQLNGLSFAVAPAPGGTTNVGTVLLQPVHYESNIGNLITFPGPNFDDRNAAVALPFAFTYYGVTYTQVFVGTNGYLTFGSGSTAFNELPTNFANGLPRIAALFDDWAPDQTAGRGVFANTQLPGKAVFTWQNVEHTVNDGNDDVSEEGNFQIILYQDGRIQFGYRKVETLGGLVGITPGGTPTTIPIKHTALQGLNVGTTEAPYERFLGVGDFQFDLQHAFITYTPASFGYSVEVQRAPQTTVRGRVLQPDSTPAGGARVTAFNRTIVTEADGSFVLTGVPALEGTVLVKAALVASNGQLFSGQSTAAQPVVNGETDIGDLSLTARGSAFETDLGQLVPHANGAFPKTEFQLQFPFRIYGQSFYGQTFNRVFLNSQGFLSLTSDCVQSQCNDRFGTTNNAVNELIFAFANTPVIAPLFSTLDPGNTGQVYVNSLPDKWIMTFVNVQQPGRAETNTFQVVLHADGTIRFAYNGIGNTHGHVGISPGLYWGASEDTWSINWTTGPVRRVPNPYPVFEMFQGGLTNLTGRNFDIDRNVLVFFPNTDGSYEVIRQQFTGPGSTSKIFFDSSVSGNNDLFSINLDGSDFTNLTNAPGDDYDATLSPDGVRIAFDSYRDDPDVINEEIYVMNLNGTGLVRLTNNNADDFRPIWSPDSSKIIFQSNRNGPYELFIMNADGSDQRSLTGYPGDFAPVWSPDGTKILINSDRDGLGGLYVMNADGTGVIHLANTGTFGGNPDGFARWSPDGTRIAFHSYRNGEGEIFIVNADGSGLVNLTNHPSADLSPQWSPDGTKILFSSLRDGGFSELYVINVDGSGLVRLTNSPLAELGEQWSPDGSQVVYTRFDNNYSWSLQIVNADGTGTRPLVNNGARNFSLEWKPIP